MNKGIRIEDVLEREGVYICTTSGVSMYPMLRDRRDKVVIRPQTGRLKKYDVPLYRRDGQYVLHRVIRVLPGGGYNIRGDNCIGVEKAIPETAVIGVLDGFWRDGREIRMDSAGYRAYSRLWVALHPIVCLCKVFRITAAKLYRKVFKK